jgi:invasion protein IalB
MTAASFIRVSAAAGALLLLAACGGSDTSSSSSSVATVDSGAVADTTVAASDTTAAPASDTTAAADTTAPAPADSTAPVAATDTTSSEVLAEASGTGTTDQPAIPTLTSEQANLAAPSGSDAAASGQPASAPAGSAAQNWLKICDPTQSGQRACIMRQVVVTPDNHFLGSFLLRDDPSQESRLLAVAAVPLGVLLPFGVTWQIDGGKPVRVPYMLCDPQSCATQLVVNEAYLASLKKGTKLTLTAKNRKNEDLSITINLGGFKTVYDGQAALTPDEFTKNQSGDAALEKILANRAEQARQNLESSASAQ